MAFLTKYGTLWGQIPNTAGRVFWVAAGDSYTVDGRAYPASDNNDGLSPERALRTVNRAWDLVSANVGDVIVLLPGAHSTSASITADVAGVTMMGLPSGKGNPRRRRVTLEISANDQIVNVTAADIEIAHIEFAVSASQTGSACVDHNADADGLYVHDCSFDFTAGTASTSILGVDSTAAANDVVIERNYFAVDGAFGAAIDVGANVDAVVRWNDFVLSAGTWAAAVTTGAACDRVLIYENNFHAGNATITAGILGTTGGTASAVACWRNIFPDSATVAIDTFDAGTAELAENYQAGVGATDGGVLIVAIT